MNYEMNRKRFAMLYIVMSGILLIGCSSDNDDTVVVNPGIGVLASQTCWTEDLRGLNASCGTVSVPANYSDLGGSEVRKVGYAVLPPLNSSEASDQLPVAYLIGGPGPSATADAFEFISGNPLAFLRKDREVILMDYRGVGSSEPALSCEFPADRATASVCGSVLADSELKFSDMLSSVFARDLDQLLKALDHSQVYIYGGSYGTRIALTVMRDVPSRVSAVILDGVFPIEVNGLSQAEVAPLAGLNALVGRCADSTECTQQLGDTRSQIEALVSGWTTANISVVEQQFALEQLGKLAYHPAAPLLVKQLSEESAVESIGALRQLEDQIAYIDGEPFVESDMAPNISEEVFSRTESSVMALSIICAEEVSFLESQTIDTAVGYPFGFSDNVVDVLRGYQGGSPFDATTAGIVCNEFGAPAAATIETQAVMSSIPTLILNAGLDSQTSFAWGNQTAENLSNATTALIPMSEHITANFSECSQSLITGFMEAPNDALDTSCASDLMRPVVTDSNDAVTDILCDPLNYLFYCE